MKRIYLVKETLPDGKAVNYLVNASNQAAALRTIVEPRFLVEVPTVQEALVLGKAGVEVQEAK